MRSLLLPPTVMMLVAGLMFWLHLAIPITSLIPWPVNYLGIVPLAVGLGIAQWHARLFRRVGTNIDTFGEPGELTKEGLFGHSRNPMYLGMVIVLIGEACVLGSLSPMCGPVAFFLLANNWYIPIEEKALTAKFGNAYTDYQQSVPRWL